MDTLVSSTYRDFEAFKLLYESVMKGDEAKVKQLYNTITQTPSRPLTVSHDTLLHIAIYMKHETIAREILNNIKNNIKDDRYVLVARNALGDTVLHEAAATNMTGLAKEMLSLAPELLSMNNNLGETPLFRATHHGQAQMFKILAHEVDRKGREFRQLHLSRADSTSILHISILAEFFDLAFEIAKRYPCLVNKKDENGMIGLQLLSSNPSAFKSGRNLGLLQRLLYHCIPSEYHDHGIESQEDKEVRRQLGLSASEDEDDDLPQTFITRCVQQCSYILEQILGSALKKINIWIWRVFREGWPMMGDIYNEKKRHESALRLAKLLIKEDTSWEVSRSKEDSGKISLGHFADSPDQSTSDHKLKQGDDKDQEGNIKATSSKNGKAEDLGKTTLKEETTTTDPDQLPHLGPPITPPDPSTDGVVSVMVNQDEGDQNKAPEISKETPKDKGPLGGGLPNPIKEITHNTASSSSESTKATKKAKKASSYPPATSLLIATSTGIVEIVNEILRVYPQAVEHVSDMGQNILHVVIKHRKLEIFKRVKKMHLPMSRLVRRIDDNGYTILHHVGVMMYYTGGTLPGPALQLQEELRWFERVRKIIPPHYAMHKSQYGQRSETAEELFRRTHENLLKEAQEWLKRTSESCSAVAVLIATVAFAAAYTVPGGSNQDTGVPILLTDPFFLVFTVMDVLSLASSLTSVVMFLSILTSPFELQDFRRSLPRKLILAFTFLFFSVAVTMLAFAATIILIIHLKKRWTTSIIYAVAFLPVTMFALLQFPLYMAFMDTMKSTLKVIKKALPWYAVPRCLKTTFSKTRKTL